VGVQATFGEDRGRIGERHPIKPFGHRDVGSGPFRLIPPGSGSRQSCDKEQESQLGTASGADAVWLLLVFFVLLVLPGVGVVSVCVCWAALLLHPRFRRLGSRG
jgi:hypothetical protein